MTDYKEFDYKLARSIHLIKETKHYELIDEICPKLNEEEKLFLTSYFSLATAIALVDGTIYQSEVDTIHDTLPKKVNLSSSMKHAIVELNLSFSILEHGFSTLLPHFVKFLNSKMTSNQKEKFTKLLFLLAFADNHLAKLEDDLIKGVARGLELSNETYNKLKTSVHNSHKQRLVDTEVFYLKRIQPLALMPIHDKEFHEIPSNRFDVQRKHFKDNASYYYIQKMCRDIPETDILFITAYLGLAFSLVMADEKINEKELNYLKFELAQWFNFDSKILNMLMDLHVYNYKYKKDLINFTDDYIFILSQLFKREDKEEYLQLLMNLSLADNEVSPVEVLLIKRVLKIFHIESNRLEEIAAQSLGVEGSSKEMTSQKKWEN